jgi:hypothetical protein
MGSDSCKGIRGWKNNCLYLLKESSNFRNKFESSRSSAYQSRYYLQSHWK